MPETVSLIYRLKPLIKIRAIVQLLHAEFAIPESPAFDIQKLCTHAI